MPNTTRHALPYPSGTETAGNGDLAIKSLADALDTKLDIAANGTFKVMRNIAMYDEAVVGGAGYIIINTKIPFTSHMTTLRIRGYVYQPHSNVIDLTISFYPFTDGLIYNSDFSNNGSLSFKEALILSRTSDGCVAIALKPDTTSQLWQYPKIWVDGMFGAAEMPDASLKTGWTIVRAATTTGYTLKTTLPIGWRDVVFENSWVNFDSRTVQYQKSGDGWVRFRGLAKNGTIGTTMFTLPVGFRPDWRQSADQHWAVASNGAFGFVTVSGNGIVNCGVGSNIWIDFSTVAFKVAGP